MAQEIEAKLKVADFAKVRANLRKAGAKLAKQTLELNTFFDTPEQSLRKSDKGLRIRRNRDLKTRKDQLVITFKGPRKKGKLKSREEHELVVADYGDTIALFEGLGFRSTVTFEKRRETWTLGRCEVELDELPHLGRYVEIEGPSDRAIRDVMAKLSLSVDDLVTDSYASMVAKHLDKRRGAPRVLRFAK